jgi:RNA polymerase sigma factor FliA
MNDTTHDRPVIDSRSEQHTALVERVVEQIRTRVPRSVDLDALRAAGLEALALAADAHDPDQGVPFARFAETRVKAAIVERLRATDWTARGAHVQARRIDAGEEPDARVRRLTRLTAAIAELPPRQRRVIEGYFVAREPMGVLAADLGLPEARVALLRAEALVQLREALNGGADLDLWAGAGAGHVASA